MILARFIDKNQKKKKDRNVYDSSVHNILEPGNNTNAHVMKQYTASKTYNAEAPFSRK